MKIKKCNHKFHFVEMVKGWQGEKYYEIARFVCEKCGLMKEFQAKGQKRIKIK